MKQIILYSTVLIAFLFVQAHPAETPVENDNGITFYDGSWQEALNKAKKENKIIFLDAYAVWCGPCKLLKKNVFTSATVGEYYNENFINLAIDMEKDEGKSLAQRYQVTAYPTLLFIDGNGRVVRKEVGYHPEEMFLALGKEVVQQGKEG